MHKDPTAAWSGWTPKDVNRHKVAVYRLPDGTFDAIAANGYVPKGAVLLDPQPPFPTSGDPHEGTRVAMKKLEAEHPIKIAWGCFCAVQIAKKNLTVHSREVRAEMERRGIIGPNTGPEHWLGAIFKRLKKDGELRETGQKYKYSSTERGIHEREVKIWALTENADTSKYNKEPEGQGP